MSAPSTSEFATTDRACGECSACCVHLPVAAGIVSAKSKPAGEPCQHLCGGQCAIYSARPAMCRDFQCAWHKLESWPDAWRPEQSHLLCLFEQIDGATPAGLIYELQPDALDSPTGCAIIRALRRVTNFVVVVDSAKNRHKLPGDCAPVPALV